MAETVKDDGGGGVICGSIQAVSYYLTGQLFGYLLVLGRVRIDDQGSVFGKQLGKLPERAADILDIFEKVQMVSIHVEDQADLREKTQETVGILAGFCDKGTGVAGTDISADRGQDSADGNRGITLGGEKNVGTHGGSGGFSVCSGDCDGSFVIFHHLSQKLCAGEHGEGAGSGLLVFGVVRVDGGSVDDNVGFFFYIGSSLSIEDLGAQIFKMPGEIAGFGVGTGDRKTFLQENFCQAAHADAADADEMYVNRMIEIYCIHICSFLYRKIVFFLLYSACV